MVLKTTREDATLANAGKERDCPIGGIQAKGKSSRGKKVVIDGLIGCISLGRQRIDGLLISSKGFVSERAYTDNNEGDSFGDGWKTELETMQKRKNATG